ncbi:hypothetical protein [Microbacterium sp. NPDC091662]|uniref:helix-turn-helix transcriptional regulator n=1 Tax=Microbacterium sp. NPDC091662 TaxID=3364211 RepID=UPI0037FF29D5
MTDESVLQRNRIHQLLTQELRLDVVQTGGGMRPLLEWLRRADQTQWPHLLVLGVPSAGEAGPHSEAVAALRGAGVRVLAVTSLPARRIARRLLADGVEGFVSTADSEQDFLSAAGSVLAGRAITTSRARTDLQRQVRGPRLSIQEERVLALYASGLTIVEVADRIGVRHDTARKYLNRVRTKFTAAGWPARSKLQLARIAWAEGYADPDAEGILAEIGPLVAADFG